MTKLSAKLASITLASAMALSLFAVLPAYADDTPPANPVTPVTTPDDKDYTEDTKPSESVQDDPTKPESMTDEELMKRIENVGNSKVFLQADGTYRIGNPVSGGSATGDVPAGLESYYSQKLTGFENSPENSPEQTGYLIVPIDYSKPSEGNVALYLLKYPATGERKGSIVFNNGGPGGSAANYVHNMMQWSEHMKKLNENYDLVGVDPRGVKSSLPFSQCTVKDERDVITGDPYVYPTDVDKETTDNVNGTKKYVNSCFEYTGKIFGFDDAKRNLFLKNIGTTNAARDMDVLRSVLGEEKLNYMGISYGTRLGYVYAQNFPHNVGKFVLDGALNPFESTAPTKDDETPNLSDEKLRNLNAHYLSQGKELQGTFEKFAQWCYGLKDTNKSWEEMSHYILSDKEKVSCPLLLDDVQPHEGDLADDAANLATQQIQNLLRPLTTNPIKEAPLPGDSDSDIRSLSFGTAVASVKGGLYSQGFWLYIAHGLLELHKGNIDVFFTTLYGNAQGDGNDSRSAFNTINCADSANPAAASVANNIRVTNMYYAAAPFTDPGSQYHGIGGLDVCDAWPFAGTLAAGTPVENIPNVLVVSTRNDPATAYENGEVLAKALFGTELTVEGSQHGAFGKTDPGYECANDIILNHMLNGTIPADGSYPPLCTVASFRTAADVPEIPEIPVTPPTDPANKPEDNPEVAPDVKPENQPSAANAEKKDEKQVKTAGKTATKAVKAGSHKLAQTGVNVAALSVVVFMVLAVGGVLVSVRWH